MIQKARHRNNPSCSDLKLKPAVLALDADSCSKYLQLAEAVCSDYVQLCLHSAGRACIPSARAHIVCN